MTPPPDKTFPQNAQGAIWPSAISTATSALLQQALDTLDFDPARDRLFSASGI